MPEVLNMNNPASRLRYWINEFDSYPQRDRAASQAVSDVLGYESDDFDARVAFMRLGATLAELCGEVRRERPRCPTTFTQTCSCRTSTRSRTTSTD